MSCKQYLINVEKVAKINYIVLLIKKQSIKKKKTHITRCIESMMVVGVCSKSMDIIGVECIRDL